jgi:hypothetical protein
MKNKALIFVVIALGMLASFLGHYALHWAVFRAPTVLDTCSPGATYNVILNGRADQPLFPIDHTVRFTVLKNNQQLVSQRYFHSGDWLDPSFSLSYPQHAWAAENVLHFYREEFFRDGKPGMVVVSNKSGKVIKYLRITAYDAHLLFELQPGSATKLTIPPPRSDYDYILVEGEYWNGEAVNGIGISFKQDKTRPAVYFIDVAGPVPSIESPHLKNYQPE